MSKSLLLSALVTAAAAAGNRVLPDATGRFRGPDGRTQVFHGVNVVQKSHPWHPSLGAFDANTSLNAEDMTNLKSWGLNVVRLGMMWPGVEPKPGDYNHTYLEVMKHLVEDLYGHGIYTIIDFHQDAFAERFCGEGVPDWLLGMLEPIRRSCKGLLPQFVHIFGQCKSFAEYNYSVDPATGFPKTEDCLSVGFDMYSRTPEVASSWGSFLSHDAVQKKFHDFWSIVAKTFAGAPGVLGYDLINEPLNGDYYMNARLLEPGEADRTLLEPMYVSLGKVIRAADPQAVLMYEPAPFPDTVPHYVPVLGGVKPVGFETGPTPNDGAHQVLSYHIYSCGFVTDKCDRKGDPPASDCEDCDRMAMAAVDQREKDARRLGGSAFLTEFGACSGSSTCLAELHRVADMADRSLHSWAYWQFKYNHDITTVAGPEEGFYELNGELQTEKVAALSRTYAPFVAGNVIKMRYQAQTAAFQIEYATEESTMGLKTEIYLNEKLHYSQGFTVHVLGGSAAKVADNRLEVKAREGSGAGAIVNVALVPKDRTRYGLLPSTGDGSVRWKTESADSTSFELAAEDDSWRGLKVISDIGNTVCDLEVQAKQKPVRCEPTEMEQQALMFKYKIELSKAKELGIHRKVFAMDASTMGPLLGRSVSFHWALGEEASGKALRGSPAQNVEMVV